MDTKEKVGRAVQSGMLVVCFLVLFLVSKDAFMAVAGTLGIMLVGGLISWGSGKLLRLDPVKTSLVFVVAAALLCTAYSIPQVNKRRLRAEQIEELENAFNGILAAGYTEATLNYSKHTLRFPNEQWTYHQEFLEQGVRVVVDGRCGHDEVIVRITDHPWDFTPADFDIPTVLKSTVCP